ncbi:hypothetical protein CLV68_4149 [Actinokineospora cianjurensis]|uniref:Uncharacterized protein n=1 Tax=Actinokineospora cianjurensis TaxID=585224 RepID=A0A421B0Y4_9PSEU|nr:hypothetical protein CLV68_4149 [Actinokineospora cianjurensis]
MDNHEKFTAAKGADRPALARESDRVLHLVVHEDAQSQQAARALATERAPSRGDAGSIQAPCETGDSAFQQVELVEDVLACPATGHVRTAMCEDPCGERRGGHTGLESRWVGWTIAEP